MLLYPDKIHSFFFFAPFLFFPLLIIESVWCSCSLIVTYDSLLTHKLFLKGGLESGTVYLFPPLFSPCPLCSLSSSDLWLSELWLWLVCIISSLSLLSIFSSRLPWTPTPPVGDHTKSRTVTSQVWTVQMFKKCTKRRRNVWMDERNDSPLPPACMGWSMALCLAGYGWPFCVRLWMAEWLLFILTASTFITQKERNEIQAVFMCS